MTLMIRTARALAANKRSRWSGRTWTECVTHVCDMRLKDAN